MTDDTKPAEPFIEESSENTDSFNEAGWKRLMDGLEEHRKNGSLRGVFVFELFEVPTPPEDTPESDMQMYAGVFAFVKDGSAAPLLCGVHQAGETMLAPRVIADAIASGATMVLLRPEDLHPSGPPEDAAPSDASGTPPASPRQH